MTQRDWSDRPDPAEMHERYAAVVDMARRAAFRTPEIGWPAELVLAHLVATTDNFAAVGAGVRRGETPPCGAPEIVDDEVLARLVAESGGIAGVSDRLEAAAARLVAHAESLSDAEAATQVRFTVYHEGEQIVDEPRPWGRILAGQTTFHLPLHLKQLEALRK
jgi:hypothetical protein